MSAVSSGIILEGVKVGDHVVITCTDTVAISIEKQINDNNNRSKEANMKKVVKMAFAVLFGLTFLVSTALAEDIKFSGFLGDQSVYDKLTPGPEGGIKLRWIKPGIDAKKYNKYMVDSVIFFLADNSQYKGIDPQEMKELADQFNMALVAAFKGKWPIVADPGPDVARLRVAITNIKQSRPGESVVTSIVPVGLGISLVKKGVTGGWSGSGETGVESMLLDSMTNTVIGMGVDQKQAEFDQRFSKWGSAADAFKFWSENLVRNLDRFHGITR
jgi:hypothetical protein